MERRNRCIFIILLFILVGYIYIYPDLRFIWELGKDFQGISFVGAPDETVYLSRLAGVIYRQDKVLANVGVYGHQSDPIFLPPLPEVIEGTLGRFFNLEAWQTDIWATFLFPLILSFLIYFLAYSISASFKSGVLCTLGVMLGYYWITPNFKALLSLSPDYFTNSLLFVRPISPQFNFIPFTLALYLVHQASIRKSFSLVVLTSITVGILFYTNIYYWTFIYAGMAILLFINLARHNISNVKKYILIYLFSFLLGIPFCLDCVSLANLPHFSEILARSGAVSTRLPLIPFVDTTSLILLISLRQIVKEKENELDYMISFVAGGIICLNQQVITGMTMQPAHWKVFTNKIFIIICFFSAMPFFFRWLKKRKYTRRISDLLSSRYLFYFMIFAFLFCGFLQQSLYYSASSGNFRRLQSMGGVIRHIHKKLPSGSVVLTDPFRFDEDRLISVFTKNYPYASGSFFMTSSLSLQEIENRFLFALFFFGYNVEQASALFKFMNSGLFRGMQLHLAYGGTKEKNEAYINKLKDDYTALVKSDPLISLRKYKVDYVLLPQDEKIRLVSRPKIIEKLELRYSDNYYLLYKIKD